MSYRRPHEHIDYGSIPLFRPPLVRYLSSCATKMGRSLVRADMPNFSSRRGSVGVNGGMRPLKLPRHPTTAELLRAGLTFLDAEVRDSYVSWLYWNVELQA
jgi:hypothetical protein